MKFNKKIIIYICLFFIISVLSIYSSEALLPSYLNNLYLKQIMWYVIGTAFTLLIIRFKNNFIYEYIDFFYIIFVFLLIILLFFGTPINSARCWFTLPFGTFQPSEFMKIILIVKIAKEIDAFEKKKSVKKDINLLLKVGIVFIIPAVLTFLQPDTGVVLIYGIITLFMLFTSSISRKWFIWLGIFVIIFIASLLIIYFFNQDLFVKIFGTDFFLRIDRLLNWTSKSGYQLQRGMSAIGSSGFFGHGFNNTPIYFPEPQTDFIFATYASNFGFLGSFILLVLYLLFDIELIVIAKKSKKTIEKYLIIGIIGMILYQQIQNIGMTVGLLPITGITLPFISYGGSSLMSYMIILGIVINISRPKLI